MYYDLSFNADDLEPIAAREKSASAETLGYSIVATNHTAVKRLTLKDRSTFLTFFVTALGSLDFPETGGCECRFAVGQLQMMVQVLLAASSGTCIGSAQREPLEGSISLASADSAQQADHCI